MDGKTAASGANAGTKRNENTKCRRKYGEDEAQPEKKVKDPTGTTS